MKLFIASDLHGSAYYTRIMLERYAESGADKLVLLGDILYHGSRTISRVIMHRRKSRKC